MKYGGKSETICFVETESFIWKSIRKINNIGRMGPDYICDLGNKIEKFGLDEIS